MPGRGAAPQARHLAHLETRVVGQLLVALQRRRLLVFGCGQRPTLTRTHQGGSGDGKRDAPSAWPLGRRTWRSGGYTTLLFTCVSKQVRAEWGRRRPTRLALLGGAATPSCPCRPGRTPAAGPPQCPATHGASPGARGCQVGVTASSWQPRTHRDVQPLAQDFPGAGDHLELDHGQRAPPSLARLLRSESARSKIHVCSAPRGARAPGFSQACWWRHGRRSQRYGAGDGAWSCAVAASQLVACPPESHSRALRRVTPAGGAGRGGAEISGGRCAREDGCAGEAGRPGAG